MFSQHLTTSKSTLKKIYTYSTASNHFHIKSLYIEGNSWNRGEGQRKLGDFNFARTAVKVRLAELYCKSRHDFIYIFVTFTVHFARGPVSLSVSVSLFELTLQGTHWKYHSGSTVQSWSDHVKLISVVTCLPHRWTTGVPSCREWDLCGMSGGFERMCHISSDTETCLQCSVAPCDVKNNGDNTFHFDYDIKCLLSQTLHFSRHSWKSSDMHISVSLSQG